MISRYWLYLHIYISTISTGQQPSIRPPAGLSLLPLTGGQVQGHKGEWSTWVPGVPGTSSPALLYMIMEILFGNKGKFSRPSMIYNMEVTKTKMNICHLLAVLC